MLSMNQEVEFNVMQDKFTARLHEVNGKMKHIKHEKRLKERILEQLRCGVEKLFNVIKLKYADEDQIMEAIYKTDDLFSLIKTHNLSQYLGVFEVVMIKILRLAQAGKTMLLESDKQTPKGVNSMFTRSASKRSILISTAKSMHGSGLMVIY